MTTLKFLRTSLALILAANLAGCIFFETRAERAMRNNPDFRIGYSDGCASANARGTSYLGKQVRDDALFKTSQPYRAGWSNGYAVCNNQLNRSANSDVNGMPDQRRNP